MMRRAPLQLILLLLLIQLLSGCGISRTFVAPVDNLTRIAGEIPKTYTVRRGDSLYMIAMEFDLNYLDLGRWNGLKSPYTIHRGQVLRLYPPKARKKRRVAKSSSASTRTRSKGCRGDYYVVRRGDTLSEVAEICGVSRKSLAKWNRLNSPYTIHVKQKLRLKGQKGRAVAKNKPQQKRVSRSTTRTSSKSGGSTRLQRPVKGKISQRFSKAKGVTGVEFSGKRGDPVRAAGDGKVVYSGTGLVRYGKLLIIKHDNNILTAYAHNSALQVAEGDVVKAGQQIARMGSSGTDRVKLHFEVRRGGKPVDPMRYLK